MAAQRLRIGARLSAPVCIADMPPDFHDGFESMVETVTTPLRRLLSFADRLWRGQLAPLVIICGGMLVALVMISLCATVLYQGRVDAMDRARETSGNLALIAERDIERNFELYALSLQAVVDGMRDPDVLALPPRLRRQVLFDRAATAKYLGSMLVLDASGNIVVDSGSDVPRQGNFSDRPYFTAQRDNPNAGLYISDPFRSRLRNGSPSIALSRRLSHPDGSFAGIVLIAVNLEYFHTLFAGLSLGPHGAVSLIGRDGIMIMRQPYDLHTIGRDISKASTFRYFRSAPEGSFSDTASIDGVRRLYLFRNIADLPLIIMVAEAQQDIYAAWRKRTLTIGSLMVAFGLGFGKRRGAAVLICAIGDAKVVPTILSSGNHFGIRREASVGNT